jgi:hypothetical protein
LTRERKSLTAAIAVGLTILSIVAAAAIVIGGLQGRVEALERSGDVAQAERQLIREDVAEFRGPLERLIWQLKDLTERLERKIPDW